MPFSLCGAPVRCKERRQVGKGDSVMGDEKVKSRVSPTMRRSAEVELPLQGPRGTYRDLLLLCENGIASLTVCRISLGGRGQP